MSPPLRILLLEDDPSDAQLIRDIFEDESFACEITLVQTRAEFVAALENEGTDLILADYRLPAFDGLSALNLVLKTHPELPFIFVSGLLGEELAIDALKIGATDYVLKTGLSRLVPAVRRALREPEKNWNEKKPKARSVRANLISSLPRTPFPHWSGPHARTVQPTSSTSIICTM